MLGRKVLFAAIGVVALAVVAAAVKKKAQADDLFECDGDCEHCNRSNDFSCDECADYDDYDDYDDYEGYEDDEAYDDCESDYEAEPLEGCPGDCSECEMTCDCPTEGMYGASSDITEGNDCLEWGERGDIACEDCPQRSQCYPDGMKKMSKDEHADAHGFESSSLTEKLAKTAAIVGETVKKEFENETDLAKDLIDKIKTAWSNG